MAHGSDSERLILEPPVFYAPPESIEGDSVTLSSVESRHAISVLRMSVADLVVVVDGLGNGWRGEISKISSGKKVTIRFHSQVRNFGEPNVRLTLASGLSTGQKFDLVVQKGTELGVNRFVPLITEKSKVKIDDPKRARTKVTRFESVALAAIKQCRRSFRPEVCMPTPFEKFLNEISPDTPTLIFHPSKGSKPFGHVSLGSPARVNVMVGPESGFSQKEIEAATERGAQLVSLGKRILRTETAGPAICALIMNQLDELS